MKLLCIDESFFDDVASFDSYLDLNEDADPALLQKYLQNNKIYSALLPPAVLNLFGKAPNLKVLYTASERLISIYFENMTMRNFYGMSEAGAHVASFLLDKSYKNICKTR